MDKHVPKLCVCVCVTAASTGDRRVFSFKESDQPCVGLEEVEALYQAITPQVKLAGTCVIMYHLMLSRPHGQGGAPGTWAER